MALAFIIVPLLARLVFGEPLSWQTLAGGARSSCRRDAGGRRP